MKSVTRLATAIVFSAVAIPAASAQVPVAGVCLTERVQAASPLGNRASEAAKGNRAQYERIAILKWEREVTKKYGGAYADWKNAKSKSVRCPSATANRRWRCIAGGTPCVGGTLN